MGDVDIDPTSVFGVRPTELDQVHQHLHKPQNMPLQEKNILQSSFFSHAQRSPMEAVRKPPQPMDLGTPSSTGSSTTPKTTLFQTATKRSTSSKGTTLQFETPNLTPIPMQSQDASFAVNPPDSSSFADASTNPNTIRRAQKVASRLYYQLSPETPDSTQQGPSSRYLRGMDKTSSLLFGDVEGTPLRRGGRQDNSDIHHQPSTARKPRALFMMSENKNINNPEEDDQPDHANTKVQQQQQQQDEKPSTTSNIHSEEPEDGVDSHQAVQEILENLCMMGAAFWRLCQVSIQSIGNSPKTRNLSFTSTRLPLFPTRLRSIAVEKPCSCFTSFLMPNIILVGFCIRKEEPISKWQTIRTRNVVWSSCNE
jgi:hypothetical protein